VDAYNDLFSVVQTQSVEGSPLRGNQTLRSVASRISDRLVQAHTSGSGDLTLLAQIGISVQRDGQLTFDAAQFQEVLAADYNGVRDLFVQRGTNLGKAYWLIEDIDQLSDSSEGIFKISDDAFAAKIKTIDDAIDRYERGLESYQAYLEKKFAAMELMVSTLQAQGSYLTARFFT
jgi:flagellar hook-associated protein 2